MTTNTTSKKTRRVWIDDNGIVACDQHGGAYLAAAIAEHPRRRLQQTPRGTWERYDGDDLPCETCYPMHIG